MTDIALPYGLCPAQIEFELDRNRADETSPYSRVNQQQGRPGDRWRATVSWPTLMPDEAYMLSAWLDQVSKAGNCALLPVHQNDRLGTNSNDGPFADLVQPWAVNKFAGWASVQLTTPPFLSNGLAAVFGNQAPPGYIQKTFSVVTNAPYLIQFDVPPTYGLPFRITVFDGNGIIYDSGLGNTVPGRYRALVYPRTASIIVTVYAGDDTTGFARTFYGDLLIHRLFLTQGAVASGAAHLLAQGGTNGVPNPALKQGQFFVVVNSVGQPELKRVQRDSHMFGGGNVNGTPVTHVGVTPFEPAMRGSIATNQPIEFARPYCRMRLATAGSRATIREALKHAFAVEFIEEL